MGDNIFECVCQFFRAQSENLSSIVNGLSNHSTISDIDTDVADLTPYQQGSNVFSAATPMHFFLIFLMMMWGYMYVLGQNKEMAKKPRNFEDEEGDGGGLGEGYGGSSSSGGGGGGDSSAVS